MGSTTTDGYRLPLTAPFVKAIQVTPLLQDIPQNNCNPKVQSLDSATQVGACPAGNAAGAAGAAGVAGAAAASARGNWLA